MKVSDLSLFNSLTDSIIDAGSNLSTAQQQLATGKRVVEPSDDPAAFAQADLLQISESATTNDGNLASQVQNRLNASDGALSGISNAITSAIASATQGADGSVNASQMATIAQTVQGQLTELIQSANTNYAGVYLFGGNQTAAPPFSTVGAYAGDAGTNSAAFSTGASIQVTFNGKSIVGDSTSGAIGAMTSLISALNSGNQAAVAAALPQLNAALEQVATARASVGSSLDDASALAQNSTATTYPGKQYQPGRGRRYRAGGDERSGRHGAGTGPGLDGDRAGQDAAGEHPGVIL
jgi:flagellar hook-associated protein 3 FlgL